MRMLPALSMLMPPLATFADDLTCVPDTMYIDADCQMGHDDKASVQLRNWTEPRGVLHSDYGDVAVTRAKQGNKMQWSGKNDQGQIEMLSLKTSNFHFEYVVQLDVTSVIQKLTAKGTCKVNK